MDVIAELHKLTPRQLDKISKLLAAPEIEPEERVFIQEYVSTMDRRAAAEKAGLHPKMGNRFLTEQRWRHVADTVDQILAERESVSELKGEYVRQYLLDVLELCPTDFFLLGPDGDWMIDPIKFNDLPKNVKRLVQGVELRVVRGQVYVKVNFVSKEAALKMAVAATIGARVQVEHGRTEQKIPWDVIAGADPGAQEIEDRIRGLASAAGPAEAQEPAMATVQVLPAAG